MVRDRNSNILKTGDWVKTIPSMGLRKGQSASGVIKSIDGEYVLVYIPHILNGVKIERYGCELELVQ